ncbi:hypothetical protein CQ009_00130 [Pseudomonas sp. MYb2]|nr:hypothetical protein CQ025_05585 [Pseudomonas sp. MYb3]PRC37195.1 hypothetical protein CQ009_00130 [Pseudomonas sp. MYb2]
MCCRKNRASCAWFSANTIPIVPTLRVGMPQWTLRVRFGRDAERPGLHSHAERGNDHSLRNYPVYAPSPAHARG